MLRFDRAPALPRALGFMLAISLIAAGCSGALAKSRIKKPVAVSAQPMLEVPARAPELQPQVQPRPSWSTPYAGTATPPPVRFFTINAVLAKHDGVAVTKSAGLPPANIQVASADPSSVATPNVASDAPAGAPIAPVSSDEPFGLYTFRAPDGLLWQKWRNVEAKMRAEARAVAACRADEAPDDALCDHAARKFIAIAASATTGDIRVRVESVNRDVNAAVRYVSDYEQHGVADLWSSPLETLAAGAGDCEDYAIAKFAVLLDAGIPAGDLRVLLVRDLAVRQDHAVLTVRIDGRWLVLDNRRMALIETTDLPEFMPLFSIDQDGVSLFAAPYAERPRHESEIEMLPAADLGSLGGAPTLPLLL